MPAWFQMKLIVYNYCYYFYFYNLLRTDEEANETENDLSDEEPDVEDAADGNKESSTTEYEEKEPESKVNVQPIAFSN